MHGRGVGRIVESRHPDWRVGEIVHGKMGWQRYAIADGSPYYLMFKVRQRVVRTRRCRCSESRRSGTRLRRCGRRRLQCGTDRAQSRR
jgi:hypothetical protein